MSRHSNPAFIFPMQFRKKTASMQAGVHVANSTTEKQRLDGFRKAVRTIDLRDSFCFGYNAREGCPSMQEDWNDGVFANQCRKSLCSTQITGCIGLSRLGGHSNLRDLPYLCFSKKEVIRGCMKYCRAPRSFAFYSSFQYRDGLLRGCSVRLQSPPYKSFHNEQRDLQVLTKLFTIKKSLDTQYTSCD